MSSPVQTSGSNAWGISSTDYASSLLHSLTQSTTTTNSANSAGLNQVLQILLSGSTPQGAAAQIQQIYKMGQQTAMPQINGQVQAGGSRGGTSSYQALATNNMNAALAGQAADAVNKNAAAAGSVAGSIAGANHTQ